MTIVEMEQAFTTVDAPAIAPYRFGLMSVVTPIPDAQSDWEGLGVQWLSTACTLPQITHDPCIVDNVPALTDQGELCTVMQYQPFTVYQRRVGSIRYRAEDETAVRAQLLEVEQFGVERELWTAMAAAVTEDAASSLLAGLALVEQMLVEAYPAEGVIHMSRFTATMLNGVLVERGGRLTTPLGTPVVAGGGYGPVNGTAPTTAAIYGTGRLVLRRGEVQADTIDPSTSSNEATAFAARTYVVGWDCTAVGATITL